MFFIHQKPGLHYWGFQNMSSNYLIYMTFSRSEEKVQFLMHLHVNKVKETAVSKNTHRPLVTSGGHP